MKFIAIAAGVLALSACETMQVLAPQSVAGYEAGGILGAIDGATGAVLARCRTLDGAEVRVAIDGLSGATGLGIDAVRAERQKACAVVGAVALVGDGLSAAGVTVHGTGEAD
jgi:hypothetical protein